MKQGLIKAEEEQSKKIMSDIKAKERALKKRLEKKGKGDIIFLEEKVRERFREQAEKYQDKRNRAIQIK